MAGRFRGEREGDITAEARREFAAEFAFCFNCGDLWRKSGHGWPGLQTHEIARGPARKLAYADRTAWLRLCAGCHEAVGNLREWPIARQLALKLLCDPVWYDVERVNKLRGRAAGSVTQGEVMQWIARRLASGEFISREARLRLSLPIGD